MRFFSSLRWLLLSLLFVLPAKAQFQSGEAAIFAQVEKYYTLGMSQVDQHNKARFLDNAIGLCEQYLDRFPNGVNAEAVYHHLARAQQSQGRIEKAKRLYQLMIRKYRRGNWVGRSALQMAWLFYTNEDWSGAADHFHLASKEITDEKIRQGAQTKRVECLLKTNRTEEVRMALASILQARLHPHRQWARFMLGYQYYQDEQFEQTINTLKQLLREGVAENYRSQAMFYTGLAATELGQNVDGEEYLRQVLALSLEKPGLIAEQRRQISHNKSLAQTALMKLSEKRGNYEEVLRLYDLGDFGARGKIEARRAMAAGKSFYHLLRFQKARSAFRRVDRSVPNTPLAFEASFFTLKCDFQMRQASLPERVDAFRELYEVQFSQHEYLHTADLLKAETLYDIGKFDRASIAFSLVDPARLPAKLRQGLFYKRGWCFAEMGDHNGAVRNFSRFLDEFPDDPRSTEALAKRAASYFLLGVYESSLRDYDVVIERNSNADLTFFALQGSARVLRAIKKYELMVERYRRLLAESTDLSGDTLANANYWIGWGYFKEEKYDDAKPYLQKARELLPEFYNEPAGNLLVLLSFAQGDAKLMNDTLKALLSDYPGKLIPPHMLNWLGLQLFHDGNFVDSVRFLGRSSSHDRPNSTDISVWRILAKGQNELGQYQEALTTARIVLLLETIPRWRADALLDMAQAQLGLGDYDSAKKSAQNGLAIEARGTHTAGLNMVLGHIAYHQEDFEKALTSFELASQILVDDPVITPNALIMSASSAEKLNNISRAEELRRRLATQFPKWKEVSEEEPESE